VVTFSIPFITYLLIALQATQKTHEPIAVIDAKPQVTKEDLLDVLDRLEKILKETLEALS
jgi:hypothetical protein